MYKKSPMFAFDFQKMFINFSKSDGNIFSKVSEPLRLRMIVFAAICFSVK